ncbi:hypothetical protein [Stieleria mannarensis]|uniref:hypothetical protein n=1 Tax=Stieleria mannarensis TaxID=2755585 RepID=UPI00160154E9|nr:hypothetical protein [Rhodopirellula sp. JC639]
MPYVHLVRIEGGTTYRRAGGVTHEGGSEDPEYQALLYFYIRGECPPADDYPLSWETCAQAGFYRLGTGRGELRGAYHGRVGSTTVELYNIQESGHWLAVELGGLAAHQEYEICGSPDSRWYGYRRFFVPEDAPSDWTATGTGLVHRAIVPQFLGPVRWRMRATR